MANYRSSWAWQTAQNELAQALPRRWAHSQGVARAATGLASVVTFDHDLLIAAAILHDVGYAPGKPNSRSSTISSWWMP
ncbi:HD domain-containing protein [Nocardia lijiangensis]|uniref:HD domain-containing protein n=1 Tax=Nocardia lijiangensis TaxID=299618 RepID=UPI003D74174D